MFSISRPRTAMDDPGFWDRVSARLDKMAAPKASSRPRENPTARWKAAIEANIASGMPRAQAVLQADRDNPGLRQKMLAAVNAGANRTPATAPPASTGAPQAFSSGLSASARWKAQVESNLNNGMPRAQAISNVESTHPGLRAQMLAEANVPGAKPLGRIATPAALRRGGAGGSAADRWEDAVESFVAKGLSRPEAARKANAANPGLREQVVAAANRR